MPSTERAQRPAAGALALAALLAASSGSAARAAGGGRTPRGARLRRVRAPAGGSGPGGFAAPALAALLAALALGVLLAVSSGSAARAAAAGESSLDSLVAAERAISRHSVASGMKEAFLAHLADDAVVFRPAPVNGKQVWQARANPAGTLEWAPDHAEISGAGDLGVTSGPWEFRPAPERNLPTGYGHFNSVWKRTKSGEWRVAVDIGIEHEKPAVDLGAVELVPGPEHEKPKAEPREFGGAVFGGGLFSSGTGVGVGFASGPGYVPREHRLMARAINDMMGAERALVFLTRTKGTEQAYPAHAAADLRVFRSGSLPAVGVTDALAILAKRRGHLDLVPYGDGMSASRDLGFSYGLLVARPSGAAAPDTCSYLHVWRRDNAGRWKLALDVENAFGKK
ncbi:MAG TPA: nuclear transport factor 2 family protein [Candidatus Eisenbacteria bacterium]